MMGMNFKSDESIRPKKIANYSTGRNPFGYRNLLGTAKNSTMFLPCLGVQPQL